jgi:hypothetical protein
MAAVTRVAGLRVHVALTGAALLPLAGARVVGRAEPGPGGEAPGGAEGRHADADLGDDGGSGQRVHAGDGHEEGLPGGGRAHGGADRRLELGEVAADLPEAP